MTDEPSDPCPQCGEEMDGHLALEYEACLRALATTSETGDRVRELARICYWFATFASGLRDAGHGDAATEVEQQIGRLRALAATAGHDRGLDLSDPCERARVSDVLDGLRDALSDYDSGLFADRLRTLAAPQPGITREAVIEAVQQSVRLEHIDEAEAVADRLGLVDEDESEEG